MRPGRSGRIKWRKLPSERQYRAAESYLALHLPTAEARRLVVQLRAAPVQFVPAKDILRASGHDAVPPSDPRVAKKLRRIEEGRRLSPVLLVRGHLHERLPLVVADGFHRVCAAKAASSGAEVACKLVDLHPQADQRVVPLVLPSDVPARA